MKKFTITITGECPDEIPDEWIHAAAAAAEVQVFEPEVANPDDPHNNIEWKTFEVATTVVIDA